MVPEGGCLPGLIRILSLQGERGEGGPPGPAGFPGAPVSMSIRDQELHIGGPNVAPRLSAAPGREWTIR